MTDKYEKMSLFEQLKEGLKDSIDYSRGVLTLATTELPAPPARMAPRRVAQLRKRFRMSQAVFAATLNVSTKTVQSWEQGTREPSEAALRMLDVLASQPEVVRGIFGHLVPKAAKSNRTSKTVGTKRAGRAVAYAER